MESEEKISTNILANRLSVLEAEKILLKEVSPTNKSKFVYSLTQKGADLLPIVIEIMDWGAKYNANSPRRELGKKIQQDKASVVRELSQVLKKKVK
ncbi:winged helix-turn-helix transcriptional regulator [Parapedobacter composti]|uniref:winged helix-turn-helix transcriptional regulator n=1 Tax=Parapedobacter composti TaxID=623281 RepID=UPI001B8C97D3|nr:helix-turn-helix domain-containing protein [Parapedobacter composti]